jgi:phage tail-like protein
MVTNQRFPFGFAQGKRSTSLGILRCGSTQHVQPGESGTTWPESMRIDRIGAFSYYAVSARHFQIMAQFSVNPKRFDPYKNFKFRIKWDGRYVAGVSKISGLRRTTEVIQHREGGDPSSSRKSPGRTEYAPITLERGVTHDPEFENWANKVWSFGAGLGSEVSLKDFRKDLILEVYNEAGQLVLAYKIYRCWVSEYQILPDLDADASAIAIEQIKLENEGWERDHSVKEPVEPSFKKS